MSSDETVEVLAVGAHPDDVEIGCGGLLAKLARQGRRVGVLDLTRAELGTRGTPEERAREAEKASAALGVAVRMNAGLPDGGVANSTQQRCVVVPFLRRFRPRVILTLNSPDRHPDHAAVHELVRDANFMAGLARIETGQPPHRAERMYYFHPYMDTGGEPDFIIDITETFDAKLEALRAYASQFFNKNYSGGDTYIASEAFWEGIEVRARYWGGRIGAHCGEAFYADGPIALDMLPGLDPFAAEDTE